jgi:hypothetical protein
MVARRFPRPVPVWPEETSQQRRRRHAVLQVLDSLLLEVEAHNLRHPGAPVPADLLTRLRRCGGPPARQLSGCDFIEAVFALQEPYLRAARLRWPDGRELAPA